MPTTLGSPRKACRWRVTAASDMARFDVYPHPDAALRKRTPYLLDVQNSHIDRIATRVVIPLRLAEDFALRMRDLNPVFEVGGKAVVLDTAALAAIALAELKKPTTNLGAQSAAVIAALDVLFGAC
jgi:toxin CcdB